MFFYHSVSNEEISASGTSFLNRKEAENVEQVVSAFFNARSETLATAANTFVGQTEAPLMVTPFISKMTMSELMALMTGGLATVAGGVLAAVCALLVFAMLPRERVRAE